LSATQIAEALDLPVRDVKQRIRQTQS